MSTYYDFVCDQHKKRSMSLDLCTTICNTPKIGGNMLLRAEISDARTVGWPNDR